MGRRVLLAAGANVVAEHAVQKYRSECVRVSARPARGAGSREALLIAVGLVRPRSGFL